jgi:hypothetical protein
MEGTSEADLESSIEHNNFEVVHQSFLDDLRHQMVMAWVHRRVDALFR